MSDRPRVLLTRSWPTSVEHRFRQRFDIDVHANDVAMSENAIRDAMTRYDAVCPTVSDQLTAAVVAATPRRARIIGNYGVGVNHIDLDACRRAGVVVTNTPDILTKSTADLTLMLILMVARRAGEGEREVRSGRWRGWNPTHLLGGEVAGRTLGLVGFGRIAQAVAVRADRGFGMHVRYFARRRASPDAEGRCAARYVARLEDLLTDVDFLSIHVPGGAGTQALIGAEQLALLKPSAYLVNTARGSVVDENALASALSSGRLAGAGLDVYSNEPAVSDGLLRLDNVVLLPHLGSATLETREAMGLRVFENLSAFFDDREPRDRVV